MDANRLACCPPVYKGLCSPLHLNDESATLPEVVSVGAALKHFVVWCVILLAACGEADPSKDNNPVVVDTGLPEVDAGSDAVVVEDQAPAGLEYSVGNLNTRRFFDTVCQSGSCGDGAYEEQLSQAEFDFKVQKVATAIDRMDVDAIALEEIETQAVIDAIAAKVETPFSVVTMGETGASASLDVAVLARGELIEVRRHRDMRLTRPDGSTTSFAREFLEVHTRVEGKRVVVFAAHFKAQRNDDPGRRYAEAEAAGEILAATAAEFPDALVVLGGDLNDTPDSDPIQALLGAGGLELLTEVGFWTYRYIDNTIHIDHIVYAENGGGQLVQDSFVYFDDGSGGFGGSDHRAVKATFLLAEE